MRLSRAAATRSRRRIYWSDDEALNRDVGREIQNSASRLNFTERDAYRRPPGWDDDGIPRRREIQESPLAGQDYFAQRHDDKSSARTHVARRGRARPPQLDTIFSY